MCILNGVPGVSSMVVRGLSIGSMCLMMKGTSARPFGWGMNTSWSRAHPCLTTSRLVWKGSRSISSSLPFKAVDLRTFSVWRTSLQSSGIRLHLCGSPFTIWRKSRRSRRPTPTSRLTSLHHLP